MQQPEHFLSSNDEDAPLIEVIERLQKILNAAPEHKRHLIKCGVRSYWTDNGGYLEIYEEGNWR